MFSFVCDALSPQAPAMPPPCLTAVRCSLLMKFILGLTGLIFLCSRTAHLCLFVITAVTMKVGGRGRLLPPTTRHEVGHGIFFKGSLQQDGVELH